MAGLVKFERFDPNRRSGDLLDRVASILVLVIIWRLIGGC
jgi:hypothetical protein